MTSKTKFGVVFLSTLVAVVLVIGALMGKEQQEEGAYRPLGVYSDVLKHIKSDYVEDPDLKKVTRGALQGLVEYLDPLSSYLTAEQYEEFQAKQSNPDKGTGLSTGLVIHKRMGYTTVLAVLPNSPAEKAGIRSGDLIEAIDGLNTRVMPPAYLHALLSGEPGTKARVLVRSLRDSEEPEEHLLERGEVNLAPVRRKIVEEGVGYVDIDVMDKQRVDEVEKALKVLEAEGAKKVVLDLRGNAVGETAEGVRLANLFLDEGVISVLKGKQYPEKSFPADAKSTVSRVPLAVITDRATAGGAEVAAAALLDHERAKVVGERTYGLAAVQKTIHLEEGSALILSVAKYHRPSGDAVQDGGVTPSEPVAPSKIRRFRERLHPDLDAPPPPDDAPSAAEGEKGDPYLEKALEVLAEEGSPAKAA